MHTDVVSPNQQGSPGSRRPGWLPFAIGGGALVVLAVVVVLIFTVFSSEDDGGDANAEYQAKVEEVMAPVVSANERLSRSLSALHGTRPAAAIRAVEAADDTTLSARGALNALTVPKGSEQIAVNARGTLSREAAYLSAVSAVLEDPSSETVGQTTTLAANLTDALNVVAPADEDWAQSVSGADTLNEWAPDASKALKDKAKSKTKEKGQKRGGSAGNSSPPPSTLANSRDCGGGLRAGPNTSCAFAQNVRAAYEEAPGASATVEVYSPVTGLTYSMSCAPAGAGVTCSGGNDASASWGF